MTVPAAAWPSSAAASSPSPAASPDAPLSLPLVHLVLADPGLPLVLPPCGGAAAHDHVDEEKGNVKQEQETLELPMGYRFCPTDQEVLLDYLVNKVLCRPLPADVIEDVYNLYLFDANMIPRSREFRYHLKSEHYFFTTRKKKYPNGSRPSRSTPNGYWKATGRDNQITEGGVLLGFRKTLVFYDGKPPGGTKTYWTMQEFRLNPNIDEFRNYIYTEMNSYVVCKVYERKEGVHDEKEKG